MILLYWTENFVIDFVLICQRHKPYLRESSNDYTGLNFLFLVGIVVVVLESYFIYGDRESQSNFHLDLCKRKL